MNVENMRLAILALNRVHDTNQPFNILHWYGDTEFDDELDTFDALDCNTAACALGWISREPWAQEAGMTILDECPAFVTQDYVSITFEQPYYSDSKKAWVYMAYDAAVLLFDISIDQSAWLFAANEYAQSAFSVTAKDVANRMLTLLNEEMEASTPVVIELPELEDA